MELSAQDKQLLDLAAQLLWQKGVHNPLESQIANGLTQFAQRAAKEPTKPEEKK